jgi:hypothetical protein
MAENKTRAAKEHERLYRAIFSADCRGSFKKFLGQISRILLAPDKRLTDDFVLIRAGETPQKSLTSFLINERSERITLRTPPGVQLDRKVAVINDALKRCAI